MAALSDFAAWLLLARSATSTRPNLNACSRSIAAVGSVKLNGSKGAISGFAPKAFRFNRTMSVGSNSG